MKSSLTPWGPIRYRAGPSYDKAVRTSDVPLGPRCRVKPTRAIVAGTYWLSASEEGNADSTYRSWCSVDREFHSPRMASIAEKPDVTPSARRITTKNRPPAELASREPDMWTPRTTIPRSEPRRIMTYPDRRSASTNVPYIQTTMMSTTKAMLDAFASWPWKMSTAW